MVYRIVDLLDGKVVVAHIKKAYLDKLTAFAIRYYGLHPQDFWLSADAVAGFDEDDEIQRKLADHVTRYGQFFDADANQVEDVNERGCFLGLEKVDPQATYQVTGTIRSLGGPVPGIRVIACDRDVLADDVCGITFTDDRGLFRVSFNEEDFARSALEGSPELYLHISELNKTSGEFIEIKRVNIERTKESKIVQNVNL